MKKIILILAIAILFSACDETKKIMDTAGNLNLSGAYTITTINGEEIEQNIPDISFNALEKGVTGTTGCNRFFGGYTLDLNILLFENIASTEMACEPEVMQTEFAFLEALRNTGSYTLKDGALTLYSKADRSVLLIAEKQKNSEN